MIATVEDSAAGVQWLDSAPTALVQAAANLDLGAAAGLVVHAQSGEIIGANAHACALLGLTWDALVGRTSIDPRWAAVSEEGYPLPGEQHPARLTLEHGQPVEGFLMGVLIPAPLGGSEATGGADALD